jgi:hypothetical protein
MRHKALIAAACVLVFGAFWAWPAFHEPAHGPGRQPCTGDDDGGWSYKIDAREWNCTSMGCTSDATASRASDEVEGTENRSRPYRWTGLLVA